jgi:hypothetical protein
MLTRTFNLDYPARSTSDFKLKWHYKICETEKRNSRLSCLFCVNTFNRFHKFLRQTASFCSRKIHVLSFPDKFAKVRTFSKPLENIRGEIFLDVSRCRPTATVLAIIPTLLENHSAVVIVAFPSVHVTAAPKWAMTTVGNCDCECTGSRYKSIINTHTNAYIYIYIYIYIHTHTHIHI